MTASAAGPVTDQIASEGSGTEEAAVHAVLDEYVAAHASRDAGRILGVFTDDAVRYTLAPPLAQRPGTEYGDVAGISSWLATFDGPVVLEHRDRSVVVGDDVAFAHMLTSMTATPAGAPGSFTFWLRSSFGF